MSPSETRLQPAETDGWLEANTRLVLFEIIDFKLAGGGRARTQQEKEMRDERRVWEQGEGSGINEKKKGDWKPLWERGEKRER